jgi:hypothetical protein
VLATDASHVLVPDDRRDVADARAAVEDQDAFEEILLLGIAQFVECRGDRRDEFRRRFGERGIG